MNNENPRRAAVKLLERVEHGGAYSNILLDEKLSSSNMPARDKKFCAALFYGTLERRLTLDAAIKAYSANRSDRLSAEVRNVLRTALYQLLYMDSVPDSAAVNEAVKLLSGNRNPAVKGYVNGLLRAFIRADKKLPDGRNDTEVLSLRYSCPIPLVEKWLGEYGEATALEMLESSLGRPPVTVKVNTARIRPADLAERIRSEGAFAEVNANFSDCLDIFGGTPESLQCYRDGLFHVQDISCRICCDALGAGPGMTVLDMCAAPGGKSFTAAEMMDGKGVLYSFDLHKQRVRLIEDGAARLGLGVIKTFVNDAKIHNCDIPSADRILCDVPCSGLGVIRRKPEIKYKRLEDFERLPQIQYEILYCSSKYLKPGGKLIYSTCTLSRAENEDVANRFLEENPDFSPCALFYSGKNGSFEWKKTITPGMYNSDGFFMAAFTRSR